MFSTNGNSSNTSIEGWPLNIVSKSVVPDLGNPIINVGSCVLLFKLEFDHDLIFKLSKNAFLSLINFRKLCLFFFHHKYLN